MRPVKFRHASRRGRPPGMTRNSYWLRQHEISRWLWAISPHQEPLPTAPITPTPVLIMRSKNSPVRHDAASGSEVWILSLVRRKPDRQLRRLTRSSIVEVTEVEPGPGEEAVEEAGPVLHPPEPGLDQCGQLADVVLGEVGQ
jgi:hypothetical protein